MAVLNAVKDFSLQHKRLLTDQEMDAMHCIGFSCCLCKVSC